MTDDLSTRIADAERRGAEMLETKPWAKTARFDTASGRIVVDLSNGCSFAFPARLAQGLEDASPDALAEVEILGQGYGLHWEKLDVDLSIPGLLWRACSAPKPSWTANAPREPAPRPLRRRRMPRVRTAGKGGVQRRRRGDVLLHSLSSNFMRISSTALM